MFVLYYMFSLSQPKSRYYGAARMVRSGTYIAASFKRNKKGEGLFYTQTITANGKVDGWKTWTTKDYEYATIAMTTSTTMPTSQTVSIRNMDCQLYSWTTEKPKGIALLFHGFLAHGMYPTVRYAAELLHNDNFAVLAPDFPGHGKSPGLRGYLPSSTTLVSDAVTVAEYAVKMYPGIPFFLVGSSMGGCLALHAALELSHIVCGVVLLAPMLALSVSSLERTALQYLSYIVPTLRLIPSSATSPEKQYSDAEKRRECQDDELAIPGLRLRVASACTCVDLSFEIQTKLDRIKFPFLCMIATHDVVVKNQGSLQLMVHTSVHGGLHIALTFCQ